MSKVYYVKITGVNEEAKEGEVKIGRSKSGEEGSVGKTPKSEPPKLKIKPVLENLGYAYLEENAMMLVVISSKLEVSKKEKTASSDRILFFLTLSPLCL